MKALFFIMGFSLVLFGSQFSVIISKKAPFSTLTTQQVRDIYLLKRHFIGDVRIIPINLVGQDDARTEFESSILQMDHNRLNAYWVKQHFQGITPPLTQPSFESIKVFVQNVDGAVGYIPSNLVDSSVKVIYEF
jgi:ABC-type phosphate transport system substrate-binding protein